MNKQAITAGVICAMLGVILGAFGAHTLREKLSPEMAQAFETGVRYQFYHSFALLFTGIMYQAYSNKNVKMATWFFVAGIVLFSGSLYAMASLSMVGKSIGKLGIVTPIGGVLFVFGWLELLFGVLKKKS